MAPAHRAGTRHRIVSGAPCTQDRSVPERTPVQRVAYGRTGQFADTDRQEYLGVRDTFSPTAGAWTCTVAIALGASTPSRKPPRESTASSKCVDTTTTLHDELYGGVSAPNHLRRLPLVRRRNRIRTIALSEVRPLRWPVVVSAGRANITEGPGGDEARSGRRWIDVHAGAARRHRRARSARRRCARTTSPA